MDRLLLPDIFGLTILIVGFRPLARRVGAHANLWFLGWGLVLIHDLALLYTPESALLRVLLQWVALWAIDLCGFVFLLVSANVPTRRIGLVLGTEFAVPILLQSALFVFDVRRAVFQVAACILFLLPVAHVLARPGSRSRQTTVVGIAFALFGLAAIPVALRDPGLVAMSSLALLFLCAAYLFLIAAERLTRGVFAAVTGLVTWGLSYPLAPALRHYWPTFTVDHVVIELPQYLIICGIVLTLLEEHVERTERMAMHDPLTDLPNRRLFEERLIATMEEARLDRTTVACLVIDVDNFKTINDTLGHSAGDQLLRALAVRLSWHMGPRDILARTGGDEFTALLAGVHDEHHLRFVAGAMMSAGSVPISIDGKAVDVRISIGIALSPDHADDIDGLRRAADMAMYSAKRRGGSMLAFADEE